MSREIVSAFAAYLSEDGKRPKTIQSYVGDVTGFLDHLAVMGVDFNGDLKRFHVTGYRNLLLEEGYEATTVNKKVNSLQSFNHWLSSNGLATEHVIDLRKDRVRVAAGSEKQVEVYSEKQLFHVQSGSVSIRDRAVVLALLYTGVRVSELCNLKLRHLDLLTGHIRVTGKGGKVREVPLKPEVADAIRDYLPERSKNKYADAEELFLGQRGPLQRDAVNTLLEKLTTRASLDVRLKPHCFRHTFCTRLVRKGVPLTVVSKLAGHSSVETTARFYVSTSKEDKIQAVSAL